MITKEMLRIKLRRFYIKKTANIRRKKINSTDFTIISNNCWGGFIYQSYALKYNSPTIGLFFMAEDYINFVSDIKKWIYTPIDIIKPEESKYCEYFKGWSKFGTYPVGRFTGGDIEIHFLHYNSPESALDNWNRRLERINWNKILYKFNDQNLCNINHLKTFSELPYKNKICFSSKSYNFKNTIYISGAEKYKEISTSFEPFGKSKYIDVNKLIDKL